MIVNYVILVIFIIGLIVKIHGMFSSSDNVTDRKLKRENDILWSLIFLSVILDKLSQIAGLNF